MPSRVFANYPDFLNGDKNCVICGGWQGHALYVVKDSVKIVENNYPWVKLMFDCLDANFLKANDANHGIIYDYKRETMSYLYNQEKIEMYVVLDDGRTKYRRPYGNCMADIGHFYPGEVAYCIAFDKGFYSTRRWPGEPQGSIHSGLGSLELVRRSKLL